MPTSLDRYHPRYQLEVMDVPCGAANAANVDAHDGDHLSPRVGISLEQLESVLALTTRWTDKGKHGMGSIS